jgi:hypothetical protein
MRSNPLWLPGDVMHTLCDLSEQTLRIYSESLALPPPNLGTPVYLPPPLLEQAAYEISLMTGEVTTLYQVTLRPQSMLQDQDDMILVIGWHFVAASRVRGNTSPCPSYPTSMFFP